MNPVFEAVQVFEAIQTGIQTGSCRQRASQGSSQGSRQGSRQLSMAGLLLLAWVWAGLGARGAMAQPGTVMAIPVPAPLSGAYGGGGGPAFDPASGAVVVLPGMASRGGGPGFAPSTELPMGEPLVIPSETVPLGHWQGRSGVKEIALGEMPWMDGGMGGAIAVQGFPVQGFPVQGSQVQSFPGQGFSGQGFAGIPQGNGYGLPQLSPAPSTIAVAVKYRVVVATPNQRHVQALKQIMPEAIAAQDGQAMQVGAFADWSRANALQRVLANYGFVVQIEAL